MPKPKGGLGRGLSSLIPSSPQPQEQEAQPVQATMPGVQSTQEEARGEGRAQGILQVSIENIASNPHQPRGTFSEETLEELADSIREHGVIQPLVVAQGEQAGQYNLIAGERRLRASRLAGLEHVPVIVKEVTPRAMLELALVENLQRADLNSLEEAIAYRSLVDDFGLKQEEVAGRVGKSRAAVANALRLLRLPAVVQAALVSGAIEAGHARAILQVPDEEGQLRLAERIVRDDLNVRQAEAEARRMAEQAEQVEQMETEEVPSNGNSGDLYDPVRHLEERFRTALGTKVQLSRSRRGGRLVIYFYSDEELDRIYGAIVGEDSD